MPATQMKQRVAFKNILFATDFSSAANCAMRYAAGFAKSFGAKLYALHVKEPANYALPPEMWESAQLAQDMEIHSLRDAVKREFPEIAPEVLAGQGGLWTALSLAIEAYQIDLLVVGTRGRTGVEKVILGSQAEEILRRAPCPVLTVGPQANSQEAIRGTFASVLFATNFGPASFAAARIAVSLAEEYQSRLTLLHVIEDRGANDLAGPAEFVESSERQLRALVPNESKFWCAPRFVVEQGLAAEKILEAARRMNANLIVLGVHGQEGVPGAATHLPIATVHKIIAHAECPVLTLRG